MGHILWDVRLLSLLHHNLFHRRYSMQDVPFVLGVPLGDGYLQHDQRLLYTAASDAVDIQHAHASCAAVTDRLDLRTRFVVSMQHLLSTRPAYTQ
jgi:hypothetical protein